MRRRRAADGRGPRLLALLPLLALAGCTTTPVPLIRPAQDPVYAQAESEYLAGRYPAARAAYTRFLASPAAPPYAPEAWLRIGACHLREGAPGPALEALRRGLSDAAFPWLQAEILAATGDAYRMSGDLKHAESAYRRALETSARDLREAEVRMNLASVLARQGRWDEARQEFRSIAARFPASPQAPVAAEAARRSRALLAQGIQSTVTPLLANGQALLAVRVGPFDSWTAAESAAQGCRARGMDASVVP